MHLETYNADRGASMIGTYAPNRVQGRDPRPRTRLPSAREVVKKAA